MMFTDSGLLFWATLYTVLHEHFSSLSCF